LIDADLPSTRYARSGQESHPNVQRTHVGGPGKSALHVVGWSALQGHTDVVADVKVSVTASRSWRKSFEASRYSEVGQIARCILRPQRLRLRQRVALSRVGTGYVAVAASAAGHVHCASARFGRLTEPICRREWLAVSRTCLRLATPSNDGCVMTSNWSAVQSSLGSHFPSNLRRK